MTATKIPVLLDATGLWILIVGGGAGAEAKLKGLVDAQPRVRLVAPVVSAPVRELLSRCGETDWRPRNFEPADLDEVCLVYAMTSDSAVNARIAGLCRSRGLWHNVAHERGPGSFTSPAVWRGDTIVAAFSSLSSEPQKAVAARDDYRLAHEAL